MDFDLNEDQSLLRDSVERLAADLYPWLESRQARLKAPLGFPEEGWTAFAELGVAGLPFSEEEGGLGGGPVFLGVGGFEARKNALAIIEAFAALRRSLPGA